MRARLDADGRIQALLSYTWSHSIDNVSSDGTYANVPPGAYRFRVTAANSSGEYRKSQKSLREIASAAPYEFIEIVVNDRKYGGGGIFNLYSTVAADSVWAPYIFVHEFGHHFAAIAGAGAADHRQGQVHHRVHGLFGGGPWTRLPG